jgi:hypothetical protein
MCGLLEGEEEWDSFLDGLTHEAFALLVSRLGSTTPSGTAGCTTRGGILTEGELALYAAEVSLSKRSGRWVSGLGLLDREDLRGLRDEVALREVLGDPVTRTALARRLLHAYAAVADPRTEAERNLAKAVFEKSGDR